MRQNGLLLKRVFLPSLFLASNIWGQSPQNSSNASSAAPANPSTNPIKSERTQFLECLLEYKNFPKIANDEQFTAVYNMPLIQLVDENILNLLPAVSLKAKYAKFNSEFQLQKSGYNKIFRKFKQTETEYHAVPLIPDMRAKKENLFVRVAEFEKELGRQRVSLVNKSLECNSSVLEYVTLDPKTRASLEAKNKAASLNLPERKNVPGRYQGSRVEREKKDSSEKKNLTPLDGEFYQTKLGKKLQRDLGGPIDYWSYDYQRDELYVQVGDEVAKVFVQVGPDGARFVKTKVGPSFDVSTKADEKVDPNAAGRFLTGDKNQETLFGKMPSLDPKLEDEQPSHGSGGKGPHDGHDH